MKRIVKETYQISNSLLIVRNINYNLKYYPRCTIWFKILATEPIIVDSNYCSTLNLGTMKTIDRKNLQKKSTSNKDVRGLLVEDPNRHHLLGRSSISKNSKIISDLILLKKANNKKNKS